MLKEAVRHWLLRPRLSPPQQDGALGYAWPNRSDAFGLAPGDALRYRFFVGMAWERARQEDSFGLTDRLSEPEVGNPLSAYVVARVSSPRTLPTASSSARSRPVPDAWVRALGWRSSEPGTVVSPTSSARRGS